MIKHIEIEDKTLWLAIRHGNISFGGNRKLKIYGMLNCSSGKRMNRENRVFFKTESEALELGYRPCGHCLIGNYKEWKNGVI